jgi:sulfur carrier protein
MTVRVNGETYELAPDPSVDALLTALDLPRRDIAVAVDGSVVPRSHWSTHLVPEGADVEVVTAMQGG